MKWPVLALLLLLVPVASASTLTVNLHEHGRITDYLNTYWVVNVNGTGTIVNPSSTDLFTVRLYFDILGLNLIDKGGDGQFQGDSLYFNRVPANSTETFSYQIVGITAVPPTLTGKGVLYTGMAKRSPRIYADVFGSLQKAPLENPAYTGRPGRLVSVTLNNPTQLQFTIQSLRVLKTPSRDPNNILREWDVVNDTNPRVLEPGGIYVNDILDKNSADGEVYWLQSDVYISNVDLVDQSNITRYTEQNLTVPVELLNYTNVSTNATKSYVTSGYVLTKEASDTVATPKQPVTLTLMLYNLGDQLRQYSVQDTLPQGFLASKDPLTWSGQVPAHGSVSLSYNATLNDTSLAGLDAFPRAQATIGGTTIYSQEVPFIRQYLPKDKVYVQKRVTYQGNNQVSVTVSVQNLGSKTVDGTTLKEFLPDSAVFSEISVTPEGKGVWKVPPLSPGQTWDVTYVTDQGPSLNTLPMLYGIPSSSVLRSIVLENVVNEAWQFVKARGIEFVGLGVVILLPLLYVLGKRFSWFT